MVTIVNPRGNMGHMNSHEPEGAAPLTEHQSPIRAYVDAAAENAPGPIVIPPSAEQVEVAVRNIKSRISWASLHWGTEHVHPDAWPHIARAALGPVLADLEKSSSASRSEAQAPGNPDVIGELEALARAASPGLWEVNEGDDEITLDKGTALTRWNEDGTVGYPARSWRTTDRLVEVDPDDYTEDDVEDLVADLTYIAAARPEVVLALIEGLRRAEAQAAGGPEQATLVAAINDLTRRVETLADVHAAGIVLGGPAKSPRPYSEAVDIEFGAWETDDIEERANDLLAVVDRRREENR